MTSSRRGFLQAAFVAVASTAAVAVCSPEIPKSVEFKDGYWIHAFPLQVSDCRTEEGFRIEAELAATKVVSLHHWEYSFWLLTRRRPHRFQKLHSLSEIHMMPGDNITMAYHLDTLGEQSSSTTLVSGRVRIYTKTPQPNSFRQLS